MAALNALAPRIGNSLTDRGLTTAIAELFGVSAILWFALWVLVTVAREAGTPEPVRRGDIWLVSAVLIAALAPMPMLSAGALLGASLWLWWRSAAGERTHRVACVALVLSLPLLWGPLILKLLGSELLALDAQIAAALIGGEAVGNIYISPGAKAAFSVGQGCSSMVNISLATVLAVSLAQKFRLPFRWSLLGWTGAATLAVVLVNCARMATIGLRPDLYIYLHHGAGMALFGWAALLVSALVIGWGISRQHDFAAR